MKRTYFPCKHNFSPNNEDGIVFVPCGATVNEKGDALIEEVQLKFECHIYDNGTFLGYRQPKYHIISLPFSEFETLIGGEMKELKVELGTEVYSLDASTFAFSEDVEVEEQLEVKDFVVNSGRVKKKASRALARAKGKNLFVENLYPDNMERFEKR